MAAEFPIHEGYLICLVVESVFYGFHLITFGFCIQAILSASKLQDRKRFQWHMLAISLTLITNATMHLGVELYDSLRAFIFYTGAGGPVAVFSELSGWPSIFMSVSIVIQILIGDAILVWRCWVVYGRSWAVVSPGMILWVLSFSAVAWTIVTEATLHTHAAVYAKQLVPEGTVFWTLTIVLNILTTGQLIWRIARVNNFNRRHGAQSDLTEMPNNRNTLTRVMRIIVESGLIYTTSAILSFSAYTAKSNAMYVIAGVDIQSVGIAFNLIIIRGSRLSDRQAHRSTRSFSQLDTPQIQFLRSSASEGVV